MPHREIQRELTDNDQLSEWTGGARVEGLPSDEGQIGQHGGVIPQTFDYSGGVLVGRGVDETAQPVLPAGQLIRARVDAPHSFELPHEATHRRYEPPRTVPIAQAAAGYTLIAPALFGLHYAKLIACFITLDAAGTIKFVQGGDGLGTGISATAAGGDLTGLMNLGGAAVPGLVLAPAPLANPWLLTAPDQPLAIFTVTGKAQGWAVIAYSPYDS